VHIQKVRKLSKEQYEGVKDYFHSQIFPTLTPLAMDFSHPFPFISNLSLNLAVVVKDRNGTVRYARIKIPNNIFPRFIMVSKNGKKVEGIHHHKNGHEYTLVLLEDVISEFVAKLFSGLEVVATYPFRTTRDAEIEISKDQASDLLTAVEESVGTRRIGMPMRLEIDVSMPENVKSLFARNLQLTNDYIFTFDGPLGLVDLWELLRIDRPDLKDRKFQAFTPAELGDDRNLFDAVRQRDWLFYYPYDNFKVFINLLNQAAEDPNVLAIKLTMYRIDKESSVIDALVKARQHNKVVSALVELKAKFDEEANINWARAMEDEGVHVVYGLEDLKVHAKICLIVRKEGSDIAQYSFISTGNFNAVTAKIYGDIAYLTANPEVGAELMNVFNSLTGYCINEEYKHLLVAPWTLQREILMRIEREISSHKKNRKGYIALKLNGLVDRDMIKALYKASQAGVKVDLNVRGICCLRPGIEGVSENITEMSIIGRFLEHARIYYFRNGGDEEVLIGSADLMPRNLHNRVEVLLAIPDSALKSNIKSYMLHTHLADNVKGRMLRSDGEWVRVKPPKKSKSHNSQEWLMEHAGIWHER
jgi:polyphosphate kinase